MKDGAGFAILKFIGKHAVFLWFGVGPGLVYGSVFDNWKWWAFTIPATILTTIAMQISADESYLQAIADATSAVKTHFQTRG